MNARYWINNALRKTTKCTYTVLLTTHFTSETIKKKKLQQVLSNLPNTLDEPEIMFSPANCLLNANCEILACVIIIKMPNFF